MLLIHGYGAFAAFSFKMAKYLQDHFHLVIIDLPGMGFSSRSD